MKKAIIYICILASGYSFAQDHFTGVSTSSRTGILNASLNPAELPNLSKKYEVNIYGMSFNVSNNILSISDLTSDTDFEELIFKGNTAVNASIDGEFSGPGFAMKWQKWGFALTSKAYVKADVIDVDPNLGDALLNGSELSILDITQINTDYNQRVSGTSWGEIALSAGRTVFENDQHQFNAGLSLKLLFPGSYSNLGVDAFRGTITTGATGAFLTNGHAAVNFSYSGNLADEGTEFGDYTSSVFGGLNGLATDWGANYQWKDPSDPKKYKINAGLSLRNIGSMTFNDSDNSSDSYVLDMEPTEELNLAEFENARSLRDIEQVLLNHPEFFRKTSTNEDFKVKLPATINLYGDFKIYTKFFITGQMQQRLQDNNGNRQVTALNSWAIIPRANLGFFEGYIPFSHGEFSGTNIGLGFRLGGFYLGSSSVLSSLSSNAKQIDFNMGFRWAFVE